jgi:hypothetical protein
MVYGASIFLSRSPENFWTPTYAGNTEQSKLDKLLASICFALSASIFLILNVYASHYSRRYLFSQLVPQSINACLAITRVFNIFSNILGKCFACARIQSLTTCLIRHSGIAWWCHMQQAAYRRFARGMVYCLHTGHQYISEVRQHGKLRTVSIISVVGVRKSAVEMVESKLTLVCGKYTPLQKFTQYFSPSDITRFAVVCLAALLLSAIDRNLNILNILFSVSLCTFAASQTIDRQNKPTRADTYQLTHLYGSRLLAFCSGMLYIFDRKGLNATKNAAYAVLNILVQSIISETRKQRHS